MGRECFKGKCTSQKLPFWALLPPLDSIWGHGRDRGASYPHPLIESLDHPLPINARQRRYKVSNYAPKAGRMIWPPCSPKSPRRGLELAEASSWGNDYKNTVFLVRHSKEETGKGSRGGLIRDFGTTSRLQATAGDGLANWYTSKRRPKELSSAEAIKSSSACERRKEKADWNFQSI